MSVKNLECLYVRSQHRDDASLLLAFEFSGAKPSERGKDLVS